MGPDIPAGIDQLQLLLDRMLTLTEWAKVTQPQDQRRLPSSFQLKDHIAEDMQALYGTFVSMANAIKDLLNLYTWEVSTAQRDQWMNRVLKLESRVRSLQVTERYKSL
jgi:hypothetical protein